MDPPAVPALAIHASAMHACCAETADHTHHLSGVMSTTVTLELYSERFLLGVGKVSPGDDLLQTLELLAAGSNVSPPYNFKVYNQVKDLLHLTAGRKVGSQPLTAEVETPVLQTLVAKVQSQEHDFKRVWQELEQLKAREVDAWTPRLRNVATQILLHACGQQNFRHKPSTSSFFRDLGEEHAGVRELATSMLVAPRQLVAQADAVISRRNRQVHPGFVADLDEEVEMVQRSITPALMQACNWECKIVMAYADVKRVFADRFLT